jgi:diguanylate cyclase (GGDEF)-like protein
MTVKHKKDFMAKTKLQALAPVKVLSVDDRPQNLLAIEDILQAVSQEANQEVISKSSGKEALKYLLTEDVAVILLDVRMPILSGLETAELIRQRKSLANTPIIFISAESPTAEEITTAYALGAVDYIAKPIVPEILKSKVSVFIELYRKSQALIQLSEEKAMPMFVEYYRKVKENTHLKEESELVNENDRLVTELKLAKQQMEVLLNSAGDGIIGINLIGMINFANPKACELLSMSLENIQANNIYNFITSISSKNQVPTLTAKPENVKKQFKKLFNKNTIGKENRCMWRTADDVLFHASFIINLTFDINEIVIGAVVIFRNINQQTKQENELIKLAKFDSLTGLVNRSQFRLSLEQALKRQERLKTTLAIFYLDLDHFKYVNDTLGHDEGDKVLMKTANKITANVRTGDTVARLGGDEFAIILFDIDSAENANIVAKKLIQSFVNQKEDFISEQVNISVSIGIALSSKMLNCIDTLLVAADTAMYAAKAAGRNTYKHYASDMQKEVEYKLWVETRLQSAIVDNEFSLLYQPKVCLLTKKIVGCEALIRWLPKNGTSVSPAKFIPIAEDSGQIQEIGKWVLNQVVKQIVEWRLQPDFQNILVSVNVSTGQLGHNDFFPLIKQTLQEYDIPPSSLEIEVTETKLMDNLALVVDELENIHQLGVKISIDDFGTGTSSIDLLRKLPLDILKIDRSFISDIGTDAKNEEIIKVILAIAKTLEIEIVAEGVETLEQLNFLSAEGCNIIQGYYFSKPINANRFYKLISNNTFSRFK